MTDKEYSSDESCFTPEELDAILMEIDLKDGQQEKYTVLKS